MSTVEEARPKSVRSLVPARLDRLPWVRFHWLIVVGLGVSWILDGLEIQIVSQAGFKDSLHLTNGDIGSLGSVYLVGEVVGALFFGRITDRIGRRKIFMLTLAIYLVGSGLAGLSWDLWSLFAFRFIAGLGIGGEYSAINSAIDELIPSHYRGRVDIAINGTYWAGAALGASANLYLLSSAVPVEPWLAARLLHRAGHRPVHHRPAPAHPGESAVADDPRLPRGGRAHRRRDRGAGQGRRR